MLPLTFALNLHHNSEFHNLIIWICSWQSKHFNVYRLEDYQQRWQCHLLCGTTSHASSTGTLFWTKQNARRSSWEPPLLAMATLWDVNIAGPTPNRERICLYRQKSMLIHRHKQDGHGSSHSTHTMPTRSGKIFSISNAVNRLRKPKLSPAR